MSDYQITTLSTDGPEAVLSVLVGGLAHEVRVTPRGHVMVPLELVRHFQREDIEAEAREVAARARLGWVA